MTFVPLDWELSGDQEDRTVSMTINEFAEQVEEVASLLDCYHRLEERYLKDARVSKPGGAS